MNLPSDKQAQVNAQNKVNAFVNTNTLILIEAFRPFVGKKVTTITDELTALVRKHLATVYAKLNESKQIRWRLRISCYSVELNATADEQGERTHYQKEQAHVLFSLRSGDLEMLYEVPSVALFKTDYSIEEIEIKQKQLAKLEEQASVLRESLAPFPRWY